MKDKIPDKKFIDKKKLIIILGLIILAYFIYAVHGFAKLFNNNNNIESEELVEGEITNDLENEETEDASEIEATSEVEGAIIENPNLSYRNTEYVTTKELADMNEYINNLLLLDDIVESGGYSSLDEMVFIRGEKYNSTEWGEILGYDNDEVYSYVMQENSALEILRTESYINIENSEYIIKPVHMVATINGIKDGIGSISGWKGDLVELMEEIEGFEDVYNEAYSKLGSENSSFSIYDVYSDIIAVNIAYSYSEEQMIGESIENYFSYAPYFNQFALFIKNEFNLTEIDQDILRETVYSSFVNDLYISYWLKLYDDIDDEMIQEICYAFADFILGHVDNYDLDEELYGIDYYENSEDKANIKDKIAMSELKKQAKLLTKYMDIGADKVREWIDEKLKENDE